MNKKILKIVYTLFVSCLIRDLTASALADNVPLVCDYYGFQTTNFKVRVLSSLGFILDLDQIPCHIASQAIPDTFPIISIPATYAVKLLEKVENQQLENDERTCLERDPERFFRRLLESSSHYLNLKGLYGYKVTLGDTDSNEILCGMKLDAMDDLLTRIIARDRLARAEKTIATLEARVQTLRQEQAAATTSKVDELNSK